MSGWVVAGSLITGGGAYYGAKEQSEAAQNAAIAGMEGQTQAAQIAADANTQAAQAQLQAAAMQDARLREYSDIARYNQIPVQVAGNRAQSQLSSLLGLGQLPLNTPWDIERLRLQAQAGAGTNTPVGAPGTMPAAPQLQDFDQYFDSTEGRYALGQFLSDYDKEKRQVESMDWHGANKVRKHLAQANLREKYPEEVMVELKKRFAGEGTLSSDARNYLDQNLYQDYVGNFEGLAPSDNLGLQMQTQGLAGMTPVQRHAYSSQLMALLPNEQQQAMTPEEAQAAAFAQFETSPGYQYRQDEAEKAIRRLASARGSLGSGSMYKDLLKTNQGLASQEYGNYVAQLQSMAGLAPTAANAVGNISTQVGSQLANVAQGAGDARSSAYLGTGNAMANAALAQGNLSGQLALAQGNIQSNLTSDLTGMLGAYIKGGGWGGAGAGGSGGGGTNWNTAYGGALEEFL